MSEMCNILINHAQSTNGLIQFTAIDWIREFVQLSGAKMLEFASGIFTAILPCLSYEAESRKGRKAYSHELEFRPKLCSNVEVDLSTQWSRNYYITLWFFPQISGGQHRP